MDIKIIMSEVLKGVTADGMITLGLGLINSILCIFFTRIFKVYKKATHRFTF